MASAIPEVHAGRPERQSIDAASIRTMLDTIQIIEQSLMSLKQALEQLQSSVAAEEKRGPFSLYGLFAATDVTWEDFQRAKRSWLKEVEGI